MKTRRHKTILPDEPNDRQFDYQNFGSGRARQRKSAHAAEPEPKPEKPTPRRRFKIKRFIKILILLVVLIVLGWASYVFSQLYSSAAKLDGHKGFFSTVGTMLPGSVPKTDGRINILLAGYSTDDPGHSGASLTDSIMIVSIDPSDHTETFISVPRDLYVNIPGFGYSKINAAYQDGQSSGFSQAGYPAGGMGLLEEIVSQNLGIKFSGYALINYTAFRDAVNAVGGVTVTINSPDPRGLYDPYTNLKLPNGQVKLNGAKALDLARARGDGPGSYGFPEGDFNRTAHQQQILAALKGKVNSINLLWKPTEIPNLINAVTDNVKSSFTLGQLETLYLDSKGIKADKTKNVTLNNYQGHDLLTSYYSYGSGDALIPAAGLDDYSQIQAAIQAILQ